MTRREWQSLPVLFLPSARLQRCSTGREQRAFPMPRLGNGGKIVSGALALGKEAAGPAFAVAWVTV